VKFSGVVKNSRDPLRRQIEQLHHMASLGSPFASYLILPQWQPPLNDM
jgi:hypothetical protein